MAWLQQIPALPLPDGPEMDDTSCPQNWTWVEGLEEALTCKAQGNPTPSITCSWNGQHQALEVPQLVTREQNRTYMCIAANHHGNVTRAVSVRVECEWQAPTMPPTPSPLHQALHRLTTATWVGGALRSEHHGVGAPRDLSTREFLSLSPHAF